MLSLLNKSICLWMRKCEPHTFSDHSYIKIIVSSRVAHEDMNCLSIHGTIFPQNQNTTITQSIWLCDSESEHVCLGSFSIVVKWYQFEQCRDSYACLLTDKNGFNCHMVEHICDEWWDSVYTLCHTSKKDRRLLNGDKFIHPTHTGSLSPIWFKKSDWLEIKPKKWFQLKDWLKLKIDKILLK